MILAAGRGERMKPLTDTLPKPLLEVKGKPLIVYHLEKFARLGVQRVVINIAWLGEKIKQALGDGSAYGVHIHYCDEGEYALETAGGILNALPFLAEKFWVVNADVYTDYSFQTVSLTDALAQLVLVHNPSFHTQGDFGLKDGYLLEQADMQFTFSGIGFYKKTFFKDMAQGKRALAPLIRAQAQKRAVKAVLYTGLWSDVGTPQRLAALQDG